MDKLTPGVFKACFPDAPDAEGWIEALSRVLPKYEVTGTLRLAAFLAHTGHESQGFTRLIENLNYSAQALANTWPRRYATDSTAAMKTPNDLALRLHRKPEAIGNNVYANRLGNGPEESGDGFRNRGHGLIQLTGAGNISEFGRAVGKTLDEAREYLLTKDGAIEGACWYWKSRGLNAYADKGDMLTLTVRINGGTLGLDDRKARYAKLLARLS